MAAETVKATPYLVEVEFSQWPVQAGAPLSVAIIPATGMNGMSGTIRMLPPPNSTALPISMPLVSFAGAPDAWSVQTNGLTSSGNWTWEIEISGLRGKGTGKMILEVEPPPPLVPRWLVGMLVGVLVPLFGLIWLWVRWRRRRRTR
jgi:hypothetical protein